MPRVSTLIPTYNRADHVGGAVETALNQTYDDIEVVVVDDGSTDATRDVLADYADHDSVRVRHNERNRGIAYTFNRAADVARGDLYCILGDDDRWHPEKVARQVQRLEALPDEYGVVYTGGVQTLAGDGRVVAYFHPDRRGDIYPEILRSFGLTPHSSHMIRREYFEAVGGFDTDFPYGVDWEMNIRLARQCKYEYLPEPLVNHRVHDDNVSTGMGTQSTLYRWIRDRFSEAYEQHPTVDRRVRHELHRLSAHDAMTRGDRRAAFDHCVSALRADPRGRTGVVLLTVLLGHQSYRAVMSARETVEAVTDLVDEITRTANPAATGSSFERKAHQWWGPA